MGLLQSGMLHKLHCLLHITVLPMFSYAGIMSALKAITGGILRTDMPRNMYLVKQVGANGSNSVLPGLGASSQSSLRLQGQQALQYQPAVFYLVGNVSIGMLPKGFGPVDCWQCRNVFLQTGTSHCLNSTKHNRHLQVQLQSW